MELQYRWSKADVEAWCDAQADQMLISNHMRVAFSRVILALCTFALTVIFLAVRETLLWMLFAVVTLFIIIMFPKLMKSNWKAQLIKQSLCDGNILCDRKLHMDETCMVFQTSVQETSIELSAIDDVQNTDSLYIIKFINGTYGVIPKTAFRANSEEDVFVRMLNRQTK